jgi:hypothetical protein
MHRLFLRHQSTCARVPFVFTSRPISMCNAPNACFSTSRPASFSSAPALSADRLHENMRGLGLSPTLEINMASAERAARGEPVFRTGFGQSPFPVHPRVVSALQANAHQKDYLPVQVG